MSVEFQRTIPILRIFDVAKAKEFYVGFLGFTVDWEHHFEDNTQAYLQMSRAGLTLHLSEHHGDCCPGSTVFVWMTGIEPFQVTGLIPAPDTVPLEAVAETSVRPTSKKSVNSFPGLSACAKSSKR